MTPDIETLIERLEDPDRYVDAIDDAIAALRAVQWRPISEAPKDEILLVTDGWRVTIARPDHPYHNGRRVVTPEWVDQTQGEWREVIHATHWMPLPTPRASKEGA